MNMEKLIEFIGKQNNLKKLSLTFEYHPTELSQWMLIIRSLPELEVIETKWDSEHRINSIAGIMTTKTNLKKIVLTRLSRKNYNNLRTIVGPEWQLEDKIHDVAPKATFLHRSTYLQTK